MTEDYMNNASGRTRKVSIRERSVRVGERIVVNGARADLTLLKERFAQGGYTGHETAHFVLFTRTEPPKQILVHRLFPDAIVPQTAQDLLHELESLGILAQRRDVGEALAGVMATTHYPDDLRRAWNRGEAQAVQRLLVLLCSSSPPVLPDFGRLSRQAVLYQRACTWGVGLRMLDSGGSQGFVGLSLCQQMPWVSEVLSLERDAAVCDVAQQIAQQQHLSALRFLQADLFSKEISEQGPFETVLALHALEGVAETEVVAILRHLLHLSTRRLVVAVPSLWEAVRDPAGRGMISPGLLEAHVRVLFPLLGRGARMWWDGTVAGLFVIERDVAGALMGK
jgi:2-polyprenyl-3-methyl-5-hydroxy-6-metoxy-1,4-benzoquinol methylase